MNESTEESDDEILVPDNRSVEQREEPHLPRTSRGISIRISFNGTDGR